MQDSVMFTLRTTQELSIDHPKGIHVSSNERLAHSFVLRVWFEPTEGSGSEGEWRGSVTNVMSLECCYFKAIPELTGFVAERLDAIEGSRIERSVSRVVSSRQKELESK